MLYFLFKLFFTLFPSPSIVLHILLLFFLLSLFSSFFKLLLSCCAFFLLLSAHLTSPFSVTFHVLWFLSFIYPFFSQISLCSFVSSESPSASPSLFTLNHLTVLESSSFSPIRLLFLPETRCISSTA